MEKRSIQESQAAYDAAFTAPFASHKWRSSRSRSHWVELEGWQDSIAGPLYEVVKTGGCGYVYSRHDSYFVGVGNRETLRLRLLGCHAGLVAGIERFRPTTPGEAEDLTYMRAVAEQMREVLEWSCEIETAAG